MIDKIKEKLAKKNLFGWQIREIQRTSYQTFLAKEKRECTRTVDTTSYSVAVHIDKKGEKGENKLGLATFRIGPHDLEALDKKLEEAVFSAQLVSNQIFELPHQPEQLPSVEILDVTISPKTVNECENRLLSAVHSESKVRLSTGEFFIDRIGTRLINHLGLNVEQEESELHTEIILLAQSGKEEKEFITRYTRRLLSDFNIENEVTTSAVRAREATKARLPKTGTFPVLIAEEPLDNLFNPLVARASGRLKYNKMIKADTGKSVLGDGKPMGDAITLWSNGLVKGMRGSNRFDSYGYPSNRTCLIEKNILKHYLADKRYADYLNIPTTGELGNTEVAGGSYPYRKLEKHVGGPKPLYILTAFSAFEPNPITGAFSAEIRSGYEVDARGKRPIKGGSVSGLLHKDLLNCCLSTEQVQRERVLVPKGVLFNSLAIAGK